MKKKETNIVELILSNYQNKTITNEDILEWLEKWKVSWRAYYNAKQGFAIAAKKIIDKIVQNDGNKFDFYIKNMEIELKALCTLKKALEDNCYILKELQSRWGGKIEYRDYDGYLFGVHDCSKDEFVKER